MNSEKYVLIEQPSSEGKYGFYGGNMDKYACGPCGHVYNPEEGDPDSGVSAGTPFDKLPDEWCCPICGAGKDAFERQ